MGEKTWQIGTCLYWVHLVSMYQNGLKKSRKLVHACVKRRDFKKREQEEKGEKNNNPTGVRLLFI